MKKNTVKGKKAFLLILLAAFVLLATQTAQIVYAQSYCPQQIAPGYQVTQYTYTDPACSNFGHNSQCYFVQCNSNISCGSIQPIVVPRNQTGQ